MTTTPLHSSWVLAEASETEEVARGNLSSKDQARTGYDASFVDEASHWRSRVEANFEVEAAKMEEVFPAAFSTIFELQQCHFFGPQRDTVFFFFSACRRGPRSKVGAQALQ